MSRTVGWMLSVAAFAVVVCLVVVAGVAVNAQRVTVAEAPQVAAVESPLRSAGGGDSLDDGSGAPSSGVDPAVKARVEAVMAGAADDPALGTLSAVVSSAGSGEALWGRDASLPSRPASSLKILTAAAALLQLDHDHRVVTRVVRYPGQDGVVLVGAGDPTLSVAGSGFYPGSASIAELADGVRAKLGGGVAPGAVVVDRSLFSDTFHSSWDRSGIEAGYIAPVESVMVDGARLALDREDARRTPDPAGGAGQALAAALGSPKVEVLGEGEKASDKFGDAAGGPEVVAEVESAPLSTRVQQMMVQSDNVLAESLAREVAMDRGLSPDFAGAAKAVRDTLAEHGLGLSGADSGEGSGTDSGEGSSTDSGANSGAGSGVNLADSSGLSPDNRVTPNQLDRVLLAAAAPDRGRSDDDASSSGASSASSSDTARLRPLLDALPVAGVSGTLAGRYNGTGAADGAGWVRAKTGTLDGTSALAGYVVTRGGDVLTFVMLSNEASLLPARAAADAAAAELHAIG